MCEKLEMCANVLKNELKTQKITGFLSIFRIKTLFYTNMPRNELKYTKNDRYSSIFDEESIQVLKFSGKVGKFMDFNQLKLTLLYYLHITFHKYF